ncbi:hypothetical protein ACFV0D_01605 [Streptomyces sp. NPDC059556]|uniref:hypothetical protein n=1 Tax=Streptomyces sp. NPDC059556 TaxID=3346863 RepID=UPI0036AC6D76
MELWTLIFAVLAAFASLVVARWEWFDRPQHGWNVHVSRDRGADETLPTGKKVYRRRQATFSVYAVGTAVVHTVRVRAPGASHVGKPEKGEDVREVVERRSLYRPTMSVGSKPIELIVFFPEAKKVYIEITWIRLRPYRMFGERIDARALADDELPAWERWQWSWRSLRPRCCAGGKRWMIWPVRTQGRWVPADEHPRIKIPETKLP